MRTVYNFVKISYNYRRITQTCLLTASVEKYGSERQMHFCKMIGKLENALVKQLQLLQDFYCFLYHTIVSSSCTNCYVIIICIIMRERRKEQYVKHIKSVLIAFCVTDIIINSLINHNARNISHTCKRYMAQQMLFGGNSSIQLNSAFRILKNRYGNNKFHC